jgi:hypothetical protein
MHCAIDNGHTLLFKPPHLAQRGQNFSYSIHSCLKCAHQHFDTPTKYVQFADTHTVHLYPHSAPATVLATLDSGADGHYLSKQDRIKANLPIL